MILTTPLLSPIKSFSSNEVYEVVFNVIGGNQVVKNTLEIQNVSDNSIVYNMTVDSFVYKHVIPKDKLINGIQYKAKIKTGDASNNWSEWSSWSVFSCVDRPVVTIPTINNNIINNQTVLFQGEYSQEFDVLQSYKFILYNQNQIPIQIFTEKYDNNLIQEITGLQNETKYYLELKTVSALSMEGSSGLCEFTPSYATPKLTSMIALDNLYEQGAIKISSNVIQLIFKTEDGTNPVYINNNAIDLTNQMIYLNNLDIDSNFSIKIFCKMTGTMHRRNSCENLEDFSANIDTSKYSFPKLSQIDMINQKQGQGSFKMVVAQDSYNLPKSTRGGILFTNVHEGKYLISAYINSNKFVKMYVQDEATTYYETNDTTQWKRVGIKYSNSSIRDIIVGLEMNVDNFPYRINDFAYIDGISIFPITENDFHNQSVSNLLLKYSYDSIPYSSTILRLNSNTNSFLELKYIDNKFHVYKTINEQSIYHHVCSNEINLNSNDTVKLLLKQIDNYCGVTAQKV